MTGVHTRMDADALHADFAAQGFVSIPGFLDAGELQTVRDNLERVVRDVVPQMPAAEVYCEDVRDPSTLKQLQRLHAYDDAMREQLFVGPFARLAEALLGDRPAPQNMQFFNKAPRANRPTPPHQDGAYFPITPMNAVTIWLALEDVSEEQGCVRYVPGSHLGGLRPHRRSGTLGFSREIHDCGAVDRAREVAFPCAAGHVIAHHALTVHRADGNQSATRHRKALGFIYYGAACRIDTQAHADYQRRLAGELRESGSLAEEDTA